MADNKIRVLIDVVADKASTSLKNFKSDLASTDGAFGKMKVAGGAAFDGLQTHIASFAMAGAGALAAFAAKAVGDFQKVALEAGNFAAMTGMAVEDASRWTAVVKPLGVELGDLQDVFNNLAGLIDTNDAALQNLGVTIAKDKSGRVDMNETVLRIIESLGQVEDPAKRAAMAARFFGEEGSRQFGPLIEQSAKLRQNLADVSEQKVIDDSELGKARRFRDSMQELRSKTEDLALTLGESLVPALTDVADVAASVGDVFGAELPGGIKVIDAVLEPIASKFRAASENIQDLKGDLLELDGPAQIVAERLREDAAAAELVAAETEATTSAYLEFQSGMLDAQSGSIDFAAAQEEAAEAQKELEETTRAASEALLEQAGILQEQVDAQRAAADAGFALRDAEDDLAEKVAGANDEMKEADGDLRKVRAVLDDVAQSAGDVADETLRVWEEQAKANGTTLTATQRQDLWNQKMIGTASTLQGPMRDAVLDYVAQVNGIPPEKVSEIKALLDEGKVAEAETALNDASRSRDAAIKADALTAQAKADLDILTAPRTITLTPDFKGKWFDSGGHIPGGDYGIVAEKRSEFVNGVLIPGPADVTGGAQTAAILARGGGGTGGGGGGATYVFAPQISALDASSFSPAFMQRLANEFEKMQGRTGRVWSRQ